MKIFGADRDDVTVVNPAYAAAIVEGQRKTWLADGIDGHELDVLVELYEARILRGEDPRPAAREMLVEALDAKRECAKRRYAEQVAAKFHIELKVADAIVEEGFTHFHANACPVYERLLGRIYAKVLAASREAYLQRQLVREQRQQERRARQSPMAQALLHAGVVNK